MEKNIVQIVIGGHSGSGKSTIASLIQTKLMELGFEVEFIKEFSDDDKFIDKKIKSLLEKKTKFVIKETQLQRYPIINDEKVVVK